MEDSIDGLTSELPPKGFAIVLTGQLRLIKALQLDQHLQEYIFARLGGIRAPEKAKLGLGLGAARRHQSVRQDKYMKEIDQDDRNIVLESLKNTAINSRTNTLNDEKVELEGLIDSEYEAEMDLKYYKKKLKERLVDLFMDISGEPELINHVVQKFQPISVRVAPSEFVGGQSVSDVLPFQTCASAGLLHHHGALQQFARLRRAWGEVRAAEGRRGRRYKWIVRIRADLEWAEPWPMAKELDRLLEAAQAGEPRVVFVPGEDDNKVGKNGRIVKDEFVIASRDAAPLYFGGLERPFWMCFTKEQLADSCGGPDALGVGNSSRPPWVECIIQWYFDAVQLVARQLPFDHRFRLYNNRKMMRGDIPADRLPADAEWHGPGPTSSSSSSAAAAAAVKKS